MSNLQTLFANRTVPDVKRFQSAIRNIRKGAKTKQQRINAIQNQTNYMNTMFNAGAELGGSDGYDTSSFLNSNDYLKHFKKADIDYMFHAIAIPNAKSKTSILGNVQDAYNVLRYLDFTAPRGGARPADYIDPHRPAGAAPMISGPPGGGPPPGGGGAGGGGAVFEGRAGAFGGLGGWEAVSRVGSIRSSVFGAGVQVFRSAFSWNSSCIRICWILSLGQSPVSAPWLLSGRRAAGCTDGALIATGVFRSSVSSVSA